MVRFVVALMLLISTACYASVPLIQKEHSAASELTKQRVQQLFVWMNSIGERKTVLTSKEMKRIYGPQVKFIVNATLMAGNREKLKAHFDQVMKNTKELHSVLPLQFIVVSGNQAAVAYHFILEDFHGEKYTDKVIALVTFHNGKVIYWRELSAHESTITMPH